MTSMTIAHASALPEGRQGGAGCAYRQPMLAVDTRRARWRRAWCLCVVLFASWPLATATGQPAVAPEQAWQAAVEHYVAGERAAASAILLRATPATLLDSSRRAFDEWRAVPAASADARR